MKQLLYITLPYAVCGLVLDTETNKIVDAAPIMSWAKGKELKEIESWVKKKHGQIQVLDTCKEPFYQYQNNTTPPMSGISDTLSGKEKKRIAQVIHIVTDMGNGIAVCSNCDKKLPNYGLIGECPNCKCILEQTKPEPYPYGGSDY